MATGFMMRHSIALLALLASQAAAAADVVLVGTFGNKAAVLSVDAGPPRTVRVGQSHGGVTVIEVGKERATVEIDGKRRVLAQGQTYSSGGPVADARQSVTLLAGAGGHILTEGQVNGMAVRFVVDTGATMVSLPVSDAIRLRIDYRKGQAGSVLTAAGPAPAYRVKLDTVRIGAIELNNVDGVVIESGLAIALLGMSFLSRVDMRQEEGRMTMTRRF
jgi:aspartyl protease family protein